jgi:hypothetical protein
MIGQRLADDDGNKTFVRVGMCFCSRRENEESGVLREEVRR